MPRFFAILLSFLILSANTGWAVSTHFCCGKAVDSRIVMDSADARGCEGETSCPAPGEEREDPAMSQRCCADLNLSIDTDQTLASDFVQPALLLPTALAPEVFSLPAAAPSPQRVTADSHRRGPPERVHVRLCTFLL